MQVSEEKTGFYRTLLLWLAVFSALLASASYFLAVPSHPPGFAIDESSICYNAHCLSQTGRDEYGESWPLFFRAFGEYKNPTIVYLLAALFRVTGPSIAVARTLSASFGALTGLLMGWLAWRITRRVSSTFVALVMTLLTPWLFESSRLVFEVALYPALVTLFLILLKSASLKPRWNWADIAFLSGALALLTYSASIGRLFGPLLAVGLVLFATRKRWPGLVVTWLLYGLCLLPLWVFHRNHPHGLSGRFQALSYLRDSNSTLENIREFARHYLANINPWRWLVTGEGDIRDHLQASASLLAISVVLAGFGLVLVFRYHRSEQWWRFLLYALVAAPLRASLTSNPFPQLRLVAFPVIFLVFAIPAIVWLDRRSKHVWLGACLLFILGQGLLFQWRYHQNAPKLWYVFDARFERKVLAPALATDRFPIALRDEPGKAGYIHALWYGVLEGIDPKRFARLPSNEPAPAGATVISTEEKCSDCLMVSRALNYLVYLVPPYSNVVLSEKKPLSSFQAAIICENPPRDAASKPLGLRFLITNTSSSEWPAVGNGDGQGSVVLQSRWRDERGAVIPDNEAEHILPYDIEPGDTVGLQLEVTPPALAGTYQLEVDLVQKGSGWFGERGSKAWTSRVQIETN